MNNLLVSGPPRSGKTTLIKNITGHPSLSGKWGGFITEEIREKGERVGFQILSYPGAKRGILARKGLFSSYRLGSYGVNIQDLEGIGCKALEEALSSAELIIIDEIGKMELFSEKFRNILLQALDSPKKLLATIMERRHEFADRIKRRKDVQIYRLRPHNFEIVLQDVLKWIVQKSAS